MPVKSKAAAVAVEQEPIEEQEPGQESPDFAGEYEDIHGYVNTGEPEEGPEDSTGETEEPGEAPEAPEAPEASGPCRITGQALLDFYNARKAAGHGHADIAHDAGYYTLTKTGQARVMTAQFNQAFLEAQGVDVGGKTTAAERTHAGLTKARVSGQGILLVSQLATRNVGALEGAVFSVEYPQGNLKGVGAQILLTLTDEVKPVVTRKRESAEEPGTPLLNQAA
jgi:hypothetical protein